MQQEYCVRQLPDISSDICLDYIGTWRHKYFVSGVYNFKNKFAFDQKTPGVGTIFSWRLKKGVKEKNKCNKVSKAILAVYFIYL